MLRKLSFFIKNWNYLKKEKNSDDFGNVVNVGLEFSMQVKIKNNPQHKSSCVEVILGCNGPMYKQLRERFWHNLYNVKTIQNHAQIPTEDFQ